MLKKLVLLSAIFGMAVSLECYSYNSYTNRPGVAHHKAYCTAFYEVEDGQGTFSGMDRDPTKMERTSWDFKQGKDCQLETQTSLGKKYDVWSCVCFSPMCNFPFAWKEFEARGHTLAPAFPVNDDIW